MHLWHKIVHFYMIDSHFSTWFRNKRRFLLSLLHKLHFFVFLSQIWSFPKKKNSLWISKSTKNNFSGWIFHPIILPIVAEFEVHDTVQMFWWGNFSLLVKSILGPHNQSYLEFKGTIQLFWMIIPTTSWFFSPTALLKMKWRKHASYYYFRKWVSPFHWMRYKNSSGIFGTFFITT